MAEVKFSQSEAQALRAALATLVVRARTGELGIVHGANRFVSTQLCLRKADIEALNLAATKLGLGKGIREVQ